MQRSGRDGEFHARCGGTKELNEQWAEAAAVIEMIAE